MIYMSVTNYDTIVNKTPEELAKFLNGNFLCSECPSFEGKVCSKNPKECQAIWLDWLKKEVDNDNRN